MAFDGVESSSVRAVIFVFERPTQLSFFLLKEELTKSSNKSFQPDWHGGPFDMLVAEIRRILTVK